MQSEQLEFFKRLPPELGVYIFSFLPLNELCNVERLSKQIQRFASSDTMWKFRIGKTKDEFYQQIKSQLERFLTNRAKYNFQLVTDDPDNNSTYKKLINELFFLPGGAFVKSVNAKKIMLSNELGFFNSPPFISERCIILSMSDEEKLNTILDNIFNDDKPNIIVVVNPPDRALNNDNMIIRYHLDDKTTNVQFFENIVNLFENKARKLNIKYASVEAKPDDLSPKKRCNIC